MPKSQRGRPKKIISSKQSPQPLIRWEESYTSLLLGVVVVIIGILFFVSLLKTTHHTQDVSSIATTASPKPTVQPTPQQQTYIIQSGDDLWHISEKFYNSGYKYVDIVQANHLANPGIIFKGDRLIIPQLNTNKDQIISEQEISPTPSGFPKTENNTNISITGDLYTIVSGDDLWHIAVRAYGDGYKWVDIATANNLNNPGLIFSGNILKIPR